LVEESCSFHFLKYLTKLLIKYQDKFEHLFKTFGDIMFGGMGVNVSFGFCVTKFTLWTPPPSFQLSLLFKINFFPNLIVILFIFGEECYGVVSYLKIFVEGVSLLNL